MNCSVSRVMISTAVGVVLSTAMIGFGFGQEPRNTVTQADQTDAGLQELTEHIHTVKWPRESLTVIAKWYTGNPENWRVLASINSKVNPRFIRIGTRIRVPKHLMDVQIPLPRSFVVVQTYTPRPKNKEDGPPLALDGSEDALDGSEDGNLDLFGPRE